MNATAPGGAAGFCRDCQTEIADAARTCPACRSPRLLRHPELHTLAIAHIDCDAFYATVEKRDHPELAHKPVIIGGGRRGVVSAACYVARTYGVHSAMPMFKALKACPDAVVIRPDMDKYAEVSRQVRALFRDATPLVEPLSLDEAFLDLAGTTRLHGRSPARTLALICARIENEIGVSASVGLSFNKFLAKVASDLDKPRGFAIIGRGDVEGFLARQPVSVIWGAGKVLQKKLAADGIRTIAQLQKIPEEKLVARYGSMGRRMARFARGEDDRKVEPHAGAKSLSAETTFEEDIADFDDLNARLWRLCETVSRRLKAKDLAGRTVVLKLRTTDFRIRTRSQTLPDPTQLADRIHPAASDLLRRETDGTRFRLIGVGLTGIGPAGGADPLDLADPDGGRRARAERAVDALRERFGRTSIGKGRGFRPGD